MNIAVVLLISVITGCVQSASALRIVSPESETGQQKLVWSSAADETTDVGLDDMVDLDVYAHPTFAGSECALWRKGWKESNADRYLGPMEPAMRKEWEHNLKGLPFPLTKNSLMKANAPEQFNGADERLIQVVNKILQRQQVDIVVIGGSMPAGDAATGHPPAKSPWPQQMEKLFHMLGYKNVHVFNLAQGMATSKYFIDTWSKVQPKLAKAHLILSDLAINDRPLHPDYSGPHSTEDDSLKHIKSIYTELMTKLSTLPKKPAVVSVEGFYCQLQLSEWCSFPLHELPHWSVLKALNIPTVSFANAVCGAGHHYWILQGDHREMKESETTPHPGDITHDLFARVVMSKVVEKIDSGCRKKLSVKYFEEDHNS